MHTFVFSIVIAAALLCGGRAPAEEPRGYIARPLAPEVPYNERARDAYQAGIWIIDEIAASETPLDAERKTQIYERARAAFEEAVSAEPRMYEALTYLGYVYRKLGRYDESLQTYERALSIKPDYVYAIEYQGEAYLGLDDFARARVNYLRLYALDTELAAKLLQAIEAWTRDTENEHDTEIESARAFVTERTRASIP
jgi:tetratricopeptide (TPR) repeat protein